MTDDDIETACQALRETPRDGHSVMVIKDKGSKSQRQRGLQWMWYKVIAKSGKGDADTTEELDARCKYRWRDIWLADDDLMSELFAHVVITYPDQVKQFVLEYLHTEKLSVSQMSEFLDSIYRYYGREIDLPLPDDLSDMLGYDGR